MKRCSAILLLPVLLVLACHSETTWDHSMNGIWKSIGSGMLLEIKDSTSYSFYDITSISCLPNHQGSLKDLEASLHKDTLTLKEGVLRYKFTRSQELPERCNSHDKALNRKDPLYNFDVFSETVKEHYAYLELNKINWDMLYKEQREKLSKASTDAELYLLIEATLDLLNDNHAFLEAPDKVYEEVEKLETKPEESSQGEPAELGDLAVAKTVASHHLQEEMTEDSWLIQWGKLTDEIGYIQVKTMWLYADITIPKALIEDMGFVDAFIETRHKMYEGKYIKKEVQGVRKTMDRVMNDLASMKSIVIDIRFNGGGQDAVSFEILRRFSAQKQQVARQKFRVGEAFTREVPIDIDGTKNAFTKPVYVLTSPQTGSAAEAFSLGSLALSNIKRIGASTQGALSTTLDKTLPNGWVFSISNEIYMDNEGTCYENVGVPVDYKLDYATDRQTFFRTIVNDLGADKQSILQAIKVLEVQ
ncbi:MAG: S41 family peptidase [Bacteroidota bacterium]